MSVASWIKSIGKIGFKPEDTDEERIKKSTLTILVLPFALAGLVWGVLYFLNGLIISGFIPFTYGILSLLSFLHFAITKKYTFFRNSQLLFILILPFLLQLSLGGFVHGSAVIIWAIISPVGALVFFKTNNTMSWFISYLLLLLIAWLINDYLYQFVEIKTTENFINAVFLLNMAGVSTLVFAIQYSYVKKQNELKKTIESRNEKLKEMDRLKTRFFANISHEFRTPLTIILGLANKQMQSANTPPLIIKDNLTIKSNANRLLELINQLLDISKLESGEERLELREDDLASCIKQHYGMFESLAKSKKQLLLFNGKKYSDNASDAPVMTFFDHEKLQKIITNLLSNAVKFSPEEGIIDVAVNKDEKYIYLEVSNTGVEIEPESIPHLFDRFYQVNSESTREHEGTGIGLALVKELID
ncbi:MAG TPA: HAMP domain-containing sensor histidine kinase, partial [Mariniflexile sp.]